MYNPNPYYQNIINEQPQILSSVQSPEIFPDFSNREYRQGKAVSFSGLRGHGVFQQILNLQGIVNSHSKVFVSITELGVFGDELKPFQGGANMSIYNVVPQDDGKLVVRGHIDWGNDLYYRLSVVVF